MNKRYADAPIGRCEKFVVARVRRGRGRPKKNPEEVIRQDMTQLQSPTDKILNRKARRMRIKVED